MERGMEAREGGGVKERVGEEKGGGERRGREEEKRIKVTIR